MRQLEPARQNPIVLRSEAEVLRYGTMVADAYLAAPSFDEAEAWRWQVLIKHIERLFERIQRGKQGVKVVFVEGQPYTNDQELQKGVEETGILYVSTDHNSHPIFTPEQNLKFRAVHDYMTHIARDLTFALRGEIAAYNAHAKMVPPDAVPALFTEVVGQASTFITKGFFPEQKIALLPFDYYRVGAEVAARRNPAEDVRSAMHEARKNPRPHHLPLRELRALTLKDADRVLASLDIELSMADKVEFLHGLEMEYELASGRVEDWSAVGLLVIEELQRDPRHYRKLKREYLEDIERQAGRAAWYERQNPDKSTDPTVLEYAVRFMHKGKTPKQAAAATKKQLHGSENLMLGGGVVEIDEGALEDALYDRILERAQYGLSRGWTPEDSVRSALQSSFYSGFDDKTLALIDKVTRETLKRGDR